MPRPSDPSLVSVTDYFAMLSNPIRLRLLLLLVKGERNVNSLCEELKLAQPTVSENLGLLRMNGMIVGKRKGKEVIYSLAPNAKAFRGRMKISLPPYSVTLEGC